MDPDQEVQAAVADVFRALKATGSCCGVVKAFRDRRFPTHGQSRGGEVTWMRLRQSQARAILRNPAYAGAYVSGRVKPGQHTGAGGFIRTRGIEQPPDRWEVVIATTIPATSAGRPSCPASASSPLTGHKAAHGLPAKAAPCSRA